jgi:hypothetical protein
MIEVCLYVRGRKWIATQWYVMKEGEVGRKEGKERKERTEGRMEGKGAKVDCDPVVRHEGRRGRKERKGKERKGRKVGWKVRGRKWIATQWYVMKEGEEGRKDGRTEGWKDGRKEGWKEGGESGLQPSGTS